MEVIVKSSPKIEIELATKVVKVGSADWNASEGESGYIENRTHYYDSRRLYSFDLSNADITYDDYGNISKVIFHNIAYIDSGFFIVNTTHLTDGYSLSDSMFLQKKDVNSVHNGFFSSHLKENDNQFFDLVCVNFVEGDSIDHVFSVIKYTDAIEEFLTTLDEEYIPNTIARTKDVEETTDELREETTTLWENLDHGKFPNLVAGDLYGHGESVPAEFSFRATGGKSIKDGRAYIKRIKGNSVVWNQILNNPAAGLADKAETDTEVRIIPTDADSNRFGNSVNVIEGHYYLQMVDILSEEGTLVGFQNYLNLDCGNKTTSTSYVKLWQIAQASASGTSYVQLWSKEGTPYRIKKDSFNLIDLTQMFQAGNEPTTIEEYEARKPIVADEYAYNEGQVIHCNTESIKSVGDNAWDEEWEVGGFSADGVPTSAANRIRSRNYIEVLANEKYYTNKYLTIFFYDDEMKFLSYMDMNPPTFTTPSGCRYIKFYLWGTEDYKHDILICLYHSGWKAEKDDQYQPYWEDTLPLPIIRKYFPQGMKKAGSAHDEIRFNKASGKLEAMQRIGSVRVADYVRRDAEGVFILSNLPKKPANNINGKYSTNVLMAGYTPDLGAFSYDVISKARIAVVDDDIWLNAENLKQYASTQEYIDAIGDTKVFYELAEPIVTEITEDFRDFYNVADFGTEQSQSSVPSAPFSADIIYQFNAVDMIRENYNEIERIKAALAKAGITL